MISINYRDPRPIYGQVKAALRRLIISGVLPEGSRLASVREMSAELAINPSTIQRAYRELEAEGYLYSVAGKGSFVGYSESAVNARKTELLEKFDELCKELSLMGIGKNALIERMEGEEQND